MHKVPGSFNSFFHSTRLLSALFEQSWKIQRKIGPVYEQHAKELHAVLLIFRKNSNFIGL